MPAKKPAAKTKAAVPFSTLRALFGLAQDDPKVTAALASAGKVTWTKPDGGDRYAIAKDAGFDILVSRPDDAKRGSPMLVHTIFLYAEGQSKHAQYADPPHGLAFSSRAELLKAMPKPERSWVIGKGKVPVTTKKVDHDRWKLDGIFLSADYNDAGNVVSILASVD